MPSTLASFCGFAALFVTTYVFLSLHISSVSKVNQLQHELSLVVGDLLYLRRGLKPPERDSKSPNPTSLEAQKVPEPSKPKTTLGTQIEILKTDIQQLQDDFDSLKRDQLLDGTGRPDFALESRGAEIVTIGSTPIKKDCSALWNFLTFGLNLACDTRNGPRNVIQQQIVPGKCWIFLGAQGKVVIRLSDRIFVDSVALDHARMELVGDVSDAPKEFAVFGMEMESPSDSNPQQLGNFRYDATAGKTLQNFLVRKSEKSFKFVMFVFNSNHGNLVKTCVYRIRVMGEVDRGH